MYGRMRTYDPFGKGLFRAGIGLEGQCQSVSTQLGKSWASPWRKGRKGRKGSASGEWRVVGPKIRGVPSIARLHLQ
jgi:hypothetical protein